jgi:nucleotide-binding universal stress UspA family protein
MLTIRTILHPTDFSDNADCAFSVAAALARDYGARLIVLHVATPPPVVGYAEGIRIPDPRESHEALRAELHRLHPADTGIEMEHRLVEGDDAAEILRTAKETHCDLIVIGTHGRTALTHLLMGSIADQVVRRAECPVVTVRQPLAAEPVSATVAATPVAAHAGATKR